MPQNTVYLVYVPWTYIEYTFCCHRTEYFLNAQWDSVSWWCWSFLMFLLDLCLVTLSIFERNAQVPSYNLRWVYLPTQSYQFCFTFCRLFAVYTLLGCLCLFGRLIFWTLCNVLLCLVITFSLRHISSDNNTPAFFFFFNKPFILE